jgi:hypothetical protein
MSRYGSADSVFAGASALSTNTRFVDAPGLALAEAVELVTAVEAERGYPTDDFQQQLSDLSVAHGRTSTTSRSPRRPTTAIHHDSRQR